MGCFGKATFTLHCTLLPKTSQEGNECNTTLEKLRAYCPTIYTVLQNKWTFVFPIGQTCHPRPTWITILGQRAINRQNSPPIRRMSPLAYLLLGLWYCPLPKCLFVLNQYMILAEIGRYIEVCLKNTVENYFRIIFELLKGLEIDHFGVIFLTASPGSRDQKKSFACHSFRFWVFCHGLPVVLHDMNRQNCALVTKNSDLSRLVFLELCFKSMFSKSCNEYF